MRASTEFLATVRSRRRPGWMAAGVSLALAAMAVAVYWPVRQFGFIDFDDPGYVWANPVVQQGLTPAGVRYALTTFTLGNWTPIVWLSLMLDRQLFGATPAGMHVENVALHAAGGVVLFLFLARATTAFWKSATVAAVFVCHPMHVESVAWIAERKDVLSTPLLLGAMVAYTVYQSSSGRRRWSAYTAVVVLFGLSLMSKSMGTTLPAVLLLLDYWPFNRLGRWDIRTVARLVVEKILLFVMVLAVSVVALRAQRAAGATDAGAVVPLFDRIGNAAVCCVLYVQKWLVPTGLAAFYPHPGGRPLAAVVAAIGVLGLITWGTFRLRRSAPFLVVGWLWFLVTLGPVIGLVQLGGQAMADRYSYLPSIGFSVAIVWGIDCLGRLLGLTYRPAMAAIAIAVLSIYAVVARRQAGYWKDTETLFAHSQDVTGPNPVSCFFLGRAEYARGDFHGAAEQFTAVVEQDPGNDRAFKVLGDIYSRSDLDRAVEYYSQAVSLAPSNSGYRIAFAVALTRRGDRVSLTSAAEQLRAVLRIEPGNVQATAGLDDIHTRLQ